MVAANQNARQRRIAVGMPLTEARSLARHATANTKVRAKAWHWCEHQPQQDLQQLKQLAVDCDRFSHQVGYQEHDAALWLDATSNSRLSSSVATAREQQMLLDVMTMFSQRGYYVSAALADTLAAAWAVARFGTQSREQTLLADGLRGRHFFIPPGETLTALSPLPIEALRLADPTVETLHCLGVETIEQLWQLPRAELPSRFGDKLLMRMDQAIGKRPETFTAYRTTPPLSVHLDLDRPTNRRELLVECLQGLLVRLSQMMKQQDRSALRISCDLEMEDGALQSLTVGLFEPSRDAKRLLHLLEMQLERRVLPKPVRYIELAAPVNVRPEQGRVQWLPGMEDAGGERAVESSVNRDIAGLIEHLSCRLGGPAVLGVRLTAEPQIERSFHFLPLTGGSQNNQRNRKSTAAAIRRHAATATARPLRVFTPPIRLHLHHQRPSVTNSWEQIPTTLRVHDRTCRITEHWGPERIETNWWRDKLIRRDYYRFEDEHGHHWWAFYDLQEQDWFVQGAFE